MTDLKGCRVMIVEDEYYLAKDVRHTLLAAAAEIVGPFPGQEEALAALEAQGLPDCAILDVNLGQGANFELADLMQSRGVPFLFFTGYDKEVIPRRFADVTRLEKPVDNARLVSAVKKACHGACS